MVPTYMYIANQLLLSRELYSSHSVTVYLLVLYYLVQYTQSLALVAL